MANLRDTSNAFYAGNYRTEARFTLCFYPHEYAMTHKMKLVERSRFVPKAGCPVPVPGWKKGAWVEDVLPADDPAHDPTREVRSR